MSWEYTGASTRAVYTERYRFVADGESGPRWGLRVLKLKKENVWVIRWGSNTENRHVMPPNTPLEVVQAVALALWRMK
jgi:hypothetical protein